MRRNVAAGSTTGPGKSYNKEQALGKTEFQFSKTAERNSKAKEK